VESIIAVSSKLHVNIYSFQKDTGGYYAHQQTLSLPNTCIRLISFTVGYKPLLGCVLDGSYTLEFIEFNGTDYAVANKLGAHPAVQATSLVIDDYNDHTFLITQDQEHTVRILSYIGSAQGFVVVYSCNPNQSSGMDSIQLHYEIITLFTDFSKCILCMQ